MHGTASQTPLRDAGGRKEMTENATSIGSLRPLPILPSIPPSFLFQPLAAAYTIC